MAVGDYALTTLENAKTYIGRIPDKDGLWLYCSASDATAATAQVTATTLVLTITGGTSAATTTLTFAGAANDTITELVAVINATAGWAAGAIYHGTAPSTDLLPTGAVSCLGAANELTLKIEDNYFIEQLVDRATDLIERYTGRKLDSRSYTHERYWGSGTRLLSLCQYPVTRVSAVKEGRTRAFNIQNTTATSTAYVEVTPTLVRLTVNGTTTDITIATYATITLLIAAIEATSGWDCSTPEATVGAMQASELLPTDGALYCNDSPVDLEIADEFCDDYHIEGGTDETRSTGMLYSADGWSRDTEYFVTYTAGYTTIPFALEMACLELVKYKWDNMKADGSKSSENLGDYSYSNITYSLNQFKLALPADLLHEVNAFKRHAL